ncbi:MAG: hypothetical protein ACOYNI_11085 [Acidimicrobiia bacterium]
MTHHQPPLPEPSDSPTGAGPNAEGSSTPVDPLASGDARRIGRVSKQVATARIPVWAVLIVLLVVAGGFGYLWIQRSTTELGPAVRDARRIQVDLLVCNETVDARNINPRQAEKDLQRLFEQQQRVASASVRIEREDCGTPTTTTASNK